MLQVETLIGEAPRRKSTVLATGCLTTHSAKAGASPMMLRLESQSNRERHSLMVAGFLTPYDVEDFQNALGRVLGTDEHPVFCTLRTRKCCEVFM